MPPYRRKSVWKIFGYWVGIISLLFFTIYPLCNWLTSLRENHHHIYFDWELAIPFIPQFVIPYLTLYALFILPPFFLDESRLVKLGKEISYATVFSGVIFLIFPSVLGFDRSVPIGEYSGFYKNIFMLDFPHNMVPSLHVVYSGFILLALYQASDKLANKAIWAFWFILICISTLLVHQHHIADLVSGTIIVLVFNYLIKEEDYDEIYSSGSHIFDDSSSSSNK